MGFHRFIVAETGAEKPYGPHSAPPTDPKQAFPESTWPKYTNFPITHGTLVGQNGNLGVNLNDTKVLSGANLAALADEIESKTTVVAPYWAEPGHEYNGSLWPRKYTNALPSGDKTTPLLALPNYGPTPKPTKAPPEPFNNWYRKEQWVWEDSKPGFWRPIDRWFPWYSGSFITALGDGNSVNTFYTLDGQKQVYLTITDPLTGQVATSKIDNKITDFSQAISQALKAFRGQASKDQARWDAEHPQERPPGGMEITTWAWLVGLGVAAWLVLAPQKVKPT